MGRLGTDPTTGVRVIWIESRDNPAQKYQLPEGLASLHRLITTFRNQDRMDAANQALELRASLVELEAIEATEAGA